MDRLVGIPAGHQEAEPGETVRLKVAVGGVVQGVGFRPFIYRLAHREHLAGFILNSPQGVKIEVEGALGAAQRFLSSLVHEAPPQARIDAVTVNFLEPTGEERFIIKESRRGEARSTLISPDLATCPDCLGELLSPGDRRYRYPFINCTNCGPRYTIIRDIPYDRDKTSMKVFEMCPDCRAEYEDPLNRRFHAEPNACWVCGPRITLRGPSGEPAECEDPIAKAREYLAEGRVVAVKGLGGFHLAADATNDAAVRLLRSRKLREEKPLAIMVRDLGAARMVAETSQEDEHVLTSTARPIVLLKKRPGSPVADSVAPGNKHLGVMLPYTPVHHLLLGGDLVALVMTSGNLSEEPIALDMRDAVERLGKIADVYLDHNREIVSRCDDSVVRIVDGRMIFMRRSRGWAPLPVEIDASPPSILACGAHLKNTIALTRRNQVFISQHVGDLENVAAYEFFKATVEHIKRIAEVVPSVVAHDLHPDYLSTRFAMGLEADRKIAVQHHHAHIASCLGEAGIDGPVIGLALDGTGYGTDGTIWGGELLLATRADFTRVGHLEQALIPGGDAAIKHVWRMALAHLYAAHGEDVVKLPLEALLGAERREIEVVLAMLRGRVNCPVTSSCGRLFDAVSCLSGVKREAKYEGQAALELEMALADDVDSAYPVVLERQGDRIVIGVRDLIREIAREVASEALGEGASRWTSRSKSRGEISAKFHNWLVRSLAEAASFLRDQHGVATVALSGGCFQNATLLGKLERVLGEAGFRVITNHLVPANDGGVSFGQAVAAAARLGAGGQ
ncbi:MAG TPA: carbamoyltransferase HypF [bacterium]|nr:carbamoyltransferase HypF [bacterium]